MKGRIARLMVPAMLAGMLALPLSARAADEAGASPQSSGQPGQPGYDVPYGMGPGMMGGYGYGMPYGMGPGMMGGYGFRGGAGYGMPYGMGPGMMEGYGYGMGPGMMDPYAQEALRLNEHQRQEIRKIEEGAANKNWDLLGKLHVEREKLYDLYGKPQLDKAAIDATYQRIAALRKEMFENRLAAQEQMRGVLNSRQRDMWRSMHRGMGYGMMPGYGDEPE